MVAEDIIGLAKEAAIHGWLQHCVYRLQYRGGPLGLHAEKGRMASLVGKVWTMQLVGLLSCVACMVATEANKNGLGLAAELSLKAAL